MRTWHCIGLALLMMLGLAVPTSASTFADRFTLTRAPAPESVVDPKGGRLNIDIVQWSTPADRDRLVAAMTQDGTGEGRLSLGVPVAADKTLGVALADYDRAPALLTDVRAEQFGTH